MQRRLANAVMTLGPEASFLKTLVICCLEGITLPSYIRIISYAMMKDPYEPTNTMEYHKGFEDCSAVFSKWRHL